MSITRYNDNTQKTETYAEGCVLSVYTNPSFQIMSDVWCSALEAKYWDAGNNRIATAVVDIYDYNQKDVRCHAEVDATPEVWAAVRAMFFKDFYEDMVATAKKDAAQISKGDTVAVTSGRSFKGVQGKVVVMKYMDYKMGWRTASRMKLGIALSDVMYDRAAPNGKIYKSYKDMAWAWIHNCEKVNQDPNAINYAEITKNANMLADHSLAKWKKER